MAQSTAIIAQKRIRSSTAFRHAVEHGLAVLLGFDLAGCNALRVSAKKYRCSTSRFARCRQGNGTPVRDDGVAS
jgi:hypothetical protein